MEITVRQARESDMPEVLKLIKELAVFEREPDAVEVSEADLLRDGFNENPAFECFVAEIDNEVLGMALIYMRYSTWKGRVLHLEDLIVNESARGKGLGRKLLDAVIIHASKLGVKRVSWVVLDWNTHAIDFYKKRGARVMDDWNIVQLDEAGIKNYVDNIE